MEVPLPGHAVDVQAAVEGLDAGREPSQAGAAGRVGAADAVIGDPHGCGPVRAADAERPHRERERPPALPLRPDGSRRARTDLGRSRGSSGAGARRFGFTRFRKEQRRCVSCRRLRRCSYSSKDGMN
jgi:hypothetical protein